MSCRSCSDGGDLDRPINQTADSEDSDHQPSAQADSNEHSNNNDDDDNGGKEKSTTTEAHGSQHSQPEMWKTKPIREETYKWASKEEEEEEEPRPASDYKRKEEWAKYERDSTTGLWMFAVSEKTCKASKGFVCKVSLKCKVQKKGKKKDTCLILVRFTHPPLRNVIFSLYSLSKLQTN